MIKKSTRLNITDGICSFERKDLAVMKALLPLWFRGGDLKLAQLLIKLAPRLSKLVSKTRVEETPRKRFSFEFNNDENLSGNNAYGVRTYLRASDGNMRLWLSYAQNLAVDGDTLPLEALIPAIKDITRIDEQAGNKLLFGTPMKEYYDLIISAIEGLGLGSNCGISVRSIEISETRFCFMLIAGNHHNRVFKVEIATISENKLDEEEDQM